jgi:hypothetical protein
MNEVTTLVDASAVTSVTKGYGWFNGIFRPESAALDRAVLPDRERQTLSEQMGVPLEQIPHDYGEYFDFLKKLGVEIYGNRTMMLLYKIDPARWLRRSRRFRWIEWCSCLPKRTGSSSIEGVNRPAGRGARKRHPGLAPDERARM